MRSFLKEIEDKFLDLEESCDKCDTPKSQCTCDDEIDEQNVTGAIAGYNIPSAFAKPGKWKQKNAFSKWENKTTTTVYKKISKQHFFKSIFFVAKYWYFINYWRLRYAK